MAPAARARQHWRELARRAITVVNYESRITNRESRITSVKRDPLLQAIAEARHADPFGCSAHTSSRTKVWSSARSSRPPSASPSPAMARDPIEMTRRHPAGIFEAVLPDTKEIPDYRLQCRVSGRRDVEDIDDPYRYGRVLSDYDLYLFGEGNHTRIYDKLGAHPMTIGGAAGVHFAVWAPNAERVSVVGDFNAWDGRVHPMRSLGASGIWEIFIPGLAAGERYKFEIRRADGEVLLKTDPFGFAFELPPLTASIVCRARLPLARREWMAIARGSRLVARSADGHLRGPSRIVGARARGRQSVPDLRASWPSG